MVFQLFIMLKVKKATAHTGAKVVTKAITVAVNYIVEKEAAEDIVVTVIKAIKATEVRRGLIITIKLRSKK